MNKIKGKILIMLALVLAVTILMPSKVKAVAVDFATGDRIFINPGATKTIVPADNPNLKSGSITVKYVGEGKIEVTFDECRIESFATANDKRRAFNITKMGDFDANGKFTFETITEAKIILNENNYVTYDVTDVDVTNPNLVEAFGLYLHNASVKMTGNNGALMITLQGETDKEVYGYHNMSNLEIGNVQLYVHMNKVKGSGLYMDPGNSIDKTNPAGLTLLNESYVSMAAQQNGESTLFDMPAYDSSLDAPVFNIENGAFLGLYNNGSSVAKPYVNNSIVPTIGLDIKSKGGDTYKIAECLKYDITDPIQHKILKGKNYVEFSNRGDSAGSNDAIIDAYEVITSDVIIDAVENGTVKADKNKVDAYDTVKLTTTPNAGYKLKSVKILKEDDTDITTSVKYDAKEKTFEMPGHAVKVEAEFEKIDYNLSAKATDGKVTFENNITTAQIGDQFKVILTPVNESYILDKLIVTNTETKEDVTSAVYDAKTGKITMKDYPITVTTTFKEKYTYEIISGDNSKVEKDEIKDIEVKIDANYKDLKKVYVNDVEIDKANYDSKEEPAIITLKKSYLETLKPGIYKMKVAFETSTGVKKDVETTFEIKEKTVQTKPEEDVQTKPNGNPQTGDNILMYVALLVLSTISCGVVFLKNKVSNN